MTSLLEQAAVLTKFAVRQDNPEITRSVVMEFMADGGELRSLLGSSKWVRVGKLADGYGTGMGDLWASQDYDWSHIRDSSPEGVQAMASAIYAIVGDRIYNAELAS